MKIRLDFVTNSSSSSYFVAYKPLPDFDEKTLHTYPILKNLIKLYTMIFNCGYNTIYNKEDWDEYLCEYCGYYDSIEELLKEEDYLLEHYNKVLTYLEKGFNISHFSLDYSEQNLEYLINKFAENNEYFIILEDD